jgi:hypothetical protein
VLGSSDTERQRLVRQAGGFAAEASWLLDQVGMEAGAKHHGAALVADGLVAASELGTLVNELEAHLADPATITLYCLLCQAWARRPSPD